MPPAARRLTPAPAGSAAGARPGAPARPAARRCLARPAATRRSRGCRAGRRARLGEREAQRREHLRDVADAAGVALVDILARQRVAPRPGADRQLDARRPRRRPPAEGQRDEVGHLLARVGAAALQPLRQLIGGALPPGLQHAAQQVLAVAEVPVEAAPRDLQRARQHVDAHLVDALVHQQLGGGIDPAIGGQCRARRLGRGGAAAWACGSVSRGGHGAVAAAQVGSMSQCRCVWKQGKDPIQRKG